jgi:hypothetical protein
VCLICIDEFAHAGARGVPAGNHRYSADSIVG